MITSITIVLLVLTIHGPKEKEREYMNLMRRKNRIRRISGTNVLAAVLLFGIGCVSLTGCDGSVSENTVSGSAVSGNAVSGGAVSDEKQEKKKYRYATDTNVYFESRTICQARRDGTHKKELFDEPEAEPGDYRLASVDEGWLYVIAAEEKRGDTQKNVLYRVPLEKDGQGYDVVKVSEKEELIRDSCIYLTCWDSRYLVYQYDTGIATYDLQERKYLSRQEDAEIVEDAGEEDSGWDIFRLSDCFVAVNEEGDIYVQDRASGNWRSCRDKKWIRWCDGQVVQTENRIFYEAEQEEDVTNLDDWLIYTCDGKTSNCFITMEQLRQSVEKAVGKGAAEWLDRYYVSLFGCGDRLYLQIEVNWDEGERNRSAYFVFSQGENESELRYEKGLTECMQSKVRPQTGRWRLWDEDDYEDEPGKVFKEKAECNDAQCVAMLNGCAYLCLYDYENDKGRMGCYELQSGAFRWVDKEEAEFGELGCEGLYYEQDLELYSVFLKGKQNLCTGIWVAPRGREDMVFEEDK